MEGKPNQRTVSLEMHTLCCSPCFALQASFKGADGEILVLY